MRAGNICTNCALHQAYGYRLGAGNSYPASVISVGWVQSDAIALAVTGVLGLGLLVLLAHRWECKVGGQGRQREQINLAHAAVLIFVHCRAVMVFKNIFSSVHKTLII